MRCRNNIAFCIAFSTFTTCAAARAVNYDEAISSVDSFLTRQLDRFPHPGDYPPEFTNAALIQTYDVEIEDPEFASLYHRADVYDSALAAIYFTQRGDIENARNLLDGIRFVQEEDPGADSMGLGVAATPWPDGALTGYGCTSYPNRRHVASTVWHGLGLLLSHPGNPDSAANPLRPLAELKAVFCCSLTSSVPVDRLPARTSPGRFRLQASEAIDIDHWPVG